MKYYLPLKIYTAANLFCILLFMLTVLPAHAQSKRHSRYVVIGYVGGYSGLIDTTLVDPTKLTHINYAFVNVQHNRAWLTNLKTDTTNFKRLVNLKRRNPDLKILISIGGWGGSRNFSDAVLTDTARQAFAASAVDIVRQYHLDGVDIDWEYPDDIGAGNIYRPEDKHNYTLMFAALRAELDKLEHSTGEKMLLTAAVGGFKRFLQQTEMDKAQHYLNYVNLMTYDYLQDSLHTVMHHTSLYASKHYHTYNYADKAVTDFIAAGVPADKLVMGLAFYGRGATMAQPGKNALGAATARLTPGGGYTFIKDSLINKKGFRHYRDHAAKASYLFNPVSGQFISYDDEWSVKNKCRYVKDKGMAGVMFWEYSEDRKEYLLKTADAVLQ